MLVAVLSGFVLALAAPVIAWAVKRAAGPLIAILPAFLFAYLLQFVPEAAVGRPWRFASPWTAVNGLEVSFRADGLSLLLGLLITLVAVVTFIGTAGVALSAPARERLLLALAALVASALGFVFADQPVLLASFSAAVSLAAFLVVTAEGGIEARVRFLPLLMIWLLADLALLALLARLFADVPGGLLGANGLTELPANGRHEPGLIVAIMAVKVIPVLFILPRAALSAPAGAALAGLVLPAMMAIVIRLVQIFPPEAHAVLAGLGVCGLLTGIIVVSGAQRLIVIFCGLAVAAASSVALEISLGSDAALTAALLTLTTSALVLPVLLAVGFAAARESTLGDLGAGHLRAPLTSGAIALSVLILAGLLPSSGLLAALVAAKAGFVQPAWVALPGMLLALTIPVAAALRIGAAILFAPQANTPRVRLVLIGPNLLLLLAAVSAGLVPAFFARAFIGPAVREAVPELFAVSLQEGALMAGAAALAGLLFWQQKRAGWLLSQAREVLPRLPRIARPVFVHEIGRRMLALCEYVKGDTALLLAALGVGLASVVALAVVSPASKLTFDLPDPALSALAAIAIAAAVLAALQRQLTHMVPLVAMVGILCVLVTLDAGAVDLAFVLLLIIVLETVILIAMGRAPARLPEESRAVSPALRCGAAVIVGAGVALVSIVASPPASFAESASGITGLINASGLALRETGVVAIERWGGVMLLLSLFGIAATDLMRREEEP